VNVIRLAAVAIFCGACTASTYPISVPVPGQPAPRVETYYRCMDSQPGNEQDTCVIVLHDIEHGRVAEGIARLDRVLANGFNSTASWDAGLVDALRGEWGAGAFKLAEALHEDRRQRPENRRLGPEAGPTLAFYLEMGRRDHTRPRIEVSGATPWDGALPLHCGQGAHVKIDRLRVHGMEGPPFLAEDGCTMEIDGVETLPSNGALLKSSGNAQVRVRGGLLQRALDLGGKSVASIEGVQVKTSEARWVHVVDEARVDVRNTVFPLAGIEVKGHGTLTGSGTGWAPAGVFCSDDATVTLEGITIDVPKPASGHTPGVHAQGRCKVVLRNVTIRVGHDVAVSATESARITIEGGVVESTGTALSANNDGVIENHGARVSGKTQQMGHGSVTGT
jgi:hypothetical protein